MDSSGGVTLSGDLTFESVPGLYEQFIKLDIAEKPITRIDLSAVQHADSAGLALLLEWKARYYFWVKRASVKMLLRMPSIIPPPEVMGLL